MIKFNFDAEIARVGNKLKLIEDAAEYYASLAVSDIVEAQMEEEDLEESVFWGADAYSKLKDWYTGVFKTDGVIGFDVRYKSNASTIIGKITELDKVMERYADAFYDDVERILNVH